MEFKIKNKVFLGGTCGNLTWRQKLIPKINISYFNPVVEDWTPECQAIEESEKEKCNIHLYVITKEMEGVFSIAEAVESVMLSKKEVVFHVIPDGFDKFQLDSLNAVSKLIKKYNGYSCIDSKLDKTINFLNRL